MKRLLFVALMLIPCGHAAAQVYVGEPTGMATPTAQQRSDLAAWAQTAWPAITPAEVRELRCRRQRLDVGGTMRTGATCAAFVETTLTAAQFETQEAAGNIARLPAASAIAADDSSVTVMLRYGPEFFYGATVTALATVVTDVWGIPAGQLSRLRIWYDAGNPPDDPPGYRMAAIRRLQVNSTERLACLRTGTCRSRVE